MIGERLFSVFDKNKDNYLSLQEFAQNLLSLYSKDFTAKLFLIFSLYDFDSDGYITREDVRLLLSYVPIECEKNGTTGKKEGKFTQEGGGNEEYIDRAESQFELDKLLEICFEKTEKLSFIDFVKAVKYKSSEIFICLYSLIKSNLPSLAKLKRVKSGSESKRMEELLHTPDKGHRVAPAKILNKFSPTSEIVKREKRRHLSNTETEDNSPIKSLSPKKTIKAISPVFFLNLHIKIHINPRRMVSTEIKNLSLKSRDSQKESVLFCECGQPMEDVKRRLCKVCLEKRKGTRIEGYLMKFTRSKSEIGKFWVAIEHQEIYTYVNKDAKKYKCMHSLIGCIVKEEQPEKKGKDLLYPFSLCFANGKTKKYFALSKAHLDKWVYALKKNTNHSNIEEYYHMKVFYLISEAIEK